MVWSITVKARTWLMSAVILGIKYLNDNGPAANLPGWLFCPSSYRGFPNFHLKSSVTFFLFTIHHCTWIYYCTCSRLNEGQGDCPLQLHPRGERGFRNVSQPICVSAFVIKNKIPSTFHLDSIPESKLPLISFVHDFCLLPLFPHRSTWELILSSLL